jgi:peptide/nickel transport system substrate-binding protein
MADRIDRRSFLTRSAALGAGLAAAGSSGGLLAACSSSSASPSSSGSKGNGVTSAKPRLGGQVIFGTEAEEKGFSPIAGTFDTTGILYARTVFDPLAIIAADGITVKPYLAESITPNADYTAWTVTLRPNLVFHNGTPCDGTALLANFEAQKAAALTGPAIANIASFSQTGPLTVTCNMSSPWVPFDYYLAGGIGGQIAFIAEPKWLDTNPPDQTNPIGTGPFVFEDWVPNDHFTATKNPHYWRSGLPYLDSITYKPIPDAQQLYSSLESGVVDIMHTSESQVTGQLKSSSYSFIDDLDHVAGEPDMGCLLLNLSKAPFSNLKVRQAAAMAISSAEYVKIIDAGGVNVPASGPFPVGSPYYAPTGYPAPNPTKAKQLIQEVRQETGQPVTISIGHTPDANTTKIAEYIQAQFQNVGVQSTLTSVQQASIINDALLGTFECLVWRQFGAVDPDLNYIFWSPTEINAVYSINMARNTDPAMQTALLKGRESPNPADRAAAYQEVASLMATDLPYVWLDRAVWSIGAATNVQNFNNPTCADGSAAFGMITGAIWPTEIWLGT